MSWVNALTRFKTKSPFDHVALYDEVLGIVYESVAGKGVHQLHYSTWRKGREGSYLFIYDVPYNMTIDMNVFLNLEGVGYDYKANLLYMFNKVDRLKHRATKKIFCSELVAMLLKFREPYLFSPDGIEKYARVHEWLSKIEVV